MCGDIFMIEIVNLTEHEITFDPAMHLPSIPSGDKIARVYFEQELLSYINDIPIYTNKNGRIKGLPKSSKEDSW